MIKKKRFRLVAFMLAIMFFFIQVTAQAIVLNSTPGESYLKYHSLIDGLIKDIGHDRYYGPNLEAAYCLTVGAPNPSGEDFIDPMPSEKGIEAILHWGYPSKDGSEFGLTLDQYRYVTQLAVWSYQREAGINRGIDRTRLKDGTRPLSSMKPAIDFLVEKGHSKQLPTFLDMGPGSEAQINGNYFISNPIKLISDYDVSNIAVSIKNISDPSIKDKVKIIDQNGNEKTNFNANESFRVKIPNTAKTGDLELQANANVYIPKVSMYFAAAPGIQDMAVLDMKSTSVNKDNIRVNWKNMPGNLEVTKKGNEGNLLDGAKFKLVDSAGNEVATKVTTNGKVIFENLPVGEYTLIEVEAPIGYVPVAPQKVIINTNATTQIELINNKIQGKVAVKKTNNETPSLNLEGAEFTIYNTGGNAVDVITTDRNGYAESKLLDYGNYTMRETKPPIGYILNNQIFNINISENNKIYNYDITNQIIKGKVKVLKVDEETNTPLKGAEFEILKDGKHVETLITDESGIAISGLLPFGEYIVKEIKAPDKYVLNGQEHVVTISENDKIIEITHTNRIIKGKVSIKKTDHEMPEINLLGAEFTIYDKDNNIVDTIVTDKNGYAESKLLNYGNYTMRETKPPVGYILNSQIFNISITEDNKVYSYDIDNNVIKGKIQIVKVDSQNEEKPVPNAEFDIIAKNVVGITPGTIVDHVITNQDGFAYTKDLRFGEYEFKEVKTPPGYWQSDKVYSMNITENNKVYVRYVKNVPIEAKLRVLKKDEFNNKPLKGVKFQIRNTDTNEIVVFKKFVGIIPIPQKTFETDENGEFITPQVLVYGNYQLEEVETAEGYIGITPIKFKVDENANLTDVIDLGTILTLDVNNKRIASNIEMLKVDSETKEPLNNVKFIVECLEGFQKGEKWELISNTEGKVNLNNLQYGKYQITEISTLWNYVLNDKPIEFEIKENDKLISLEMLNKKIRASVEVLKVDKDTKRPLENVEFKLFKDKTEVGTYKTDKNGKIIVNNLEAGNYYWQEVSPPEHYNMNDNNTYEFNISKDGEVIEKIVDNTVKTGDLDFSKTDISTGDLIEGAKIQIKGLEEQNKHINIEFISSKDGNKFKLPEGKYEIKETIAPSGYDSVTEVSTFEIKDGKITKAELKNEREQGELEFSKTDISTGDTIEGAKIKITCIEGLSKGKVIEFTSSKEGNKFILDEGKYTIEETIAPNGYNPITEVSTFEIKDGEITKAQLKNERKQGELEFSKTDISTGDTIDGAKIKITCTEGLSKGKVIEFTSSKEGNKFVLDEGKYTIEETIAPDGYNPITEASTFEIKNGEITKAQLKNERKQGELEFSKTDVSTGDIIEGAKIKITCTEGLSEGKVIEFISSKEGNKFKLDEGKYTIEETIAPYGYNPVTEASTFEIKNGEITKAQLKNKKTTGKLIFNKIDSNTGEGINGAEIKLVCTEGLDKDKEITFISNKEGNEISLLAGKYVISEVKAPEGYKTTDEKLTFEIAKEGQIVKCNLNNNKFKLVQTGSDLNSKTLIPIGAGLLLGGATFIIISRRKRD